MISGFTFESSSVFLEVEYLSLHLHLQVVQTNALCIAVLPYV